ncbi:unnamed protein product [Ambrosiozyma monospora]|uniref:Unnamed protein product n=1 Tax=Ambrosiozyma monospora TaxID=43982 RepID=A0ACB5T1P8_AMBMO|nr:unnamed protein product [Ambrosiozyma monospora]
MANPTELLSCGGDRTIALWDLNKGGIKRQFTSHLGDILSLSVNKNDPNLFVSCSCDRTARLWDVRDPANPIKFICSNKADSSVCQFFPDYNSFSVGSDDETLRLFDLRSDCLLELYDPKIVHQYMKKKNIMSNGFDQSSDEQSLRSSRMGTIDNPGVLSIDYSMSGRMMFVAYADYNPVVIWDTLKCEVVGCLEGHKDVVSQVKVSNDGVGVATGSRDYITKIWSTV